MAGFRKAKAEQAALKVAIFGPAGSGKTFTTLLLAEGITKLVGRRLAYVDTERGTDFYAKPIPARRVHPEAFDFDALYTRSITDILAACKGLDPAAYSVAVIDSMTHVWEAAVQAYTGQRMRNGQIPMQAWSKIKAPYKALMNWMLSTPLHVFLLGRQANEWGQDDDSGETIATGVKMKAEGETAYEPHVLVRMEGVKPLREDGKTVKKNAEPVPTMFVIKDRTGVLQGKVIENPTFEAVALPLMGALGHTQAAIPTDEDTAAHDQERLRQDDRERAARSAELAKQYLARFDLAKTPEQIEGIAKELTPETKKLFTPGDLAKVREGWVAATKGQSIPRAGDGPVGDEG